MEGQGGEAQGVADPEKTNNVDIQIACFQNVNEMTTMLTSDNVTFYTHPT
jgi:hypothetical protein